MKAYKLKKCIAHLQLDTIIKPLKQTGFLKGVRHILDLEADDWITQDDVSRGLDVLASNDLSYDLLVR